MSKSTCPRTALEHSMLGTGFALRAVSSAHGPLCLSATRLHGLQVTFLVRWGSEILSAAGGAVTQRLAQAWANQVLGLANLA